MRKLFKLLVAVPTLILLSAVSLLMLMWAILVLPLNIVGLFKDVPGEEVVGEWMDRVIDWHESM